MLKKIMKAALAASLVFGMSSFAYAEDGFMVGGKFRSYFGQYNSGAVDYSSYFVVKEEANVQFKGNAGKLSLYHEQESATGSDYNNTQTKLSYALPFGLLSIGNQTSIGTVPVASTGWTTSNIPNSTHKGLAVAGYSENEGIGLVIPLEGMGMVQFIMYEDADNYGAEAFHGVPSTADGSSMQLAADLKFGQIGVRFGYATAKTDDPALSTDEAYTTTNMLLGARIGLGENMSVAFDYTTAATKYSAWAEDKKTNAMDFDFQMGGIGPGKLVLSFGTLDRVDAYKMAITSVVFDAPVAKGAGFQIGYIANTTTPAVGDATTESFMGGGLYAFF
jgi:hypothetical protein